MHDLWKVAGLMFLYFIVTDLTMINNVWHVTSSTESAHVNACNKISNNSLARVWLDFSNYAYEKVNENFANRVNMCRLSWRGFCKCYYLVSVGQWSYSGVDGPDMWPYLPIQDNECGGYFQSPININTTAANNSTVQLILVNHNLTYPQTRMLNNGHNANLVLNVSDVNNLPTVMIKYANGSTTKYDFDSLHYHFGSSDDHGSEHRIDGQIFPMEMHCIYFKSAYGNYNESLKHSDGLVVISTMYEISNEIENGLLQITDILSGVRKPLEETIIPSLDLQQLFPEITDEFYDYHGSLTVPPCSQAVWWFILKNRCPVTECQMEKFRNILSDPPEGVDPFIPYYLANNIRPLQPLHNRRMYNHD